VLVVAGHWLLSLGFNYVTPVLEGPDEPNHYLFIRYLQIYHQLPIQGDQLKAVRAHHAPGYFVLGAMLLAWSPPILPGFHQPTRFGYFEFGP